MGKSCGSLSVFAGNVRRLEVLIDRSSTQKQLFEIAQEAAKYYHELVICLMDKEQIDRELLAGLSHEFSQIENEAMRKFYGKESVGPTRPIF
jgi:hypothetical protein